MPNDVCRPKDLDRELEIVMDECLLAIENSVVDGSQGFWPNMQAVMIERQNAVAKRFGELQKYVDSSRKNCSCCATGKCSPECGCWIGG